MLSQMNKWQVNIKIWHVNKDIDQVIIDKWWQNYATIFFNYVISSKNNCEQYTGGMEVRQQLIKDRENVN